MGITKKIPNGIAKKIPRNVNKNYMALDSHWHGFNSIPRIVTLDELVKGVARLKGQAARDGGLVRCLVGGGGKAGGLHHGNRLKERIIYLD